jgi:ribosomal protein S18 acetylase RimI-like enzyme
MRGRSSSCRQLSIGDLHRSVEVLSRAFQDDPLWCYLLPDASHRDTLMRDAFRPFMIQNIGSRSAYGLSDVLDAVAVWAPPEGIHPQISGISASDILKMLFSPMSMAALRYWRVFSAVSSLRRKRSSERHYYLKILAVHPESQGKGLASLLISRLLRDADESGVGVYLETFKDSNVQLYTRYGFACVDSLYLSRVGLGIWALYRRPGSPDQAT